MIKVENVKGLEKAYRDLLKSLDKKERQKVLRQAAAPIREDARSLVPEAGDEVYRYSSPKVLGKIRAPKGSGTIVATYLPENLRKAIQTLTFRRSDDVFVGPRKRKGSAYGTFGRTTSTVDPYYAHMVHNGTIHQKGQPFMLLGFLAKQAEALRIIKRELKKKIEK